MGTRSNPQLDREAFFRYGEAPSLGVEQSSTQAELDVAPVRILPIAYPGTSLGGIGLPFRNEKPAVLCGGERVMLVWGWMGMGYIYSFPYKQIYA